MGSKRTPSKWDCYANAEPDEPYFVLLGRDPSAALLVKMWAHGRATMIAGGEKPESDREMVDEALGVAEQMEAFLADWRLRKRGQ